MNNSGLSDYNKVKTASRAKKTVAKQVSNATSPIITGYFPQSKQNYRDVAVSNLNKFLSATLVAFLLLTALVYYFVTVYEMNLNTLAKETVALNTENDEMQIKLDELQSYYNVDKTVAKTQMLHKAQDVIEVPAINTPSVENINKTKNKFNVKWTMGF